MLCSPLFSKFPILYKKDLLLISENCWGNIGKPPPGKLGAEVGFGVPILMIPLGVPVTFMKGADVAMTSPGGLNDTPGISHLSLAQHWPGIDIFVQ